MGAAFAMDHKRDCAMISKQCLEMFQCNPEFAIYYCRRNMDPLLHIRDEGTVKTMEKKFTG